MQSAGVLRCGVGEGIACFSIKDGSRRRTGVDADFCRAVAAAALGNGEKVAFVPLFASARFPALKPNQIDLLVRNTTQTLGREVNIGTHFVGILYYDGRSFMVPAGSRAHQVRDLGGASICIVKESSHIVHLADNFKAQGLNCRPIIVDSGPQVRDEFFAGTLGGNATLIGAAAIIVSAGICASNGKPVGFTRFMHYGIPLTACKLKVSAVYVTALSFWLGK